MMRHTRWVYRRLVAQALSRTRGGSACCNTQYSRLLYRLWHEDAGQSALIITFLFSILLFGFVALGIDVGFVFHQQRMAQAAADAAAVAAAEAKTTGNSGYMQTAANAMAKLNGFDPADPIDPAQVTVHPTPTTGNYSTGANVANYVEVIVSRNAHTSFMGFLNPALALMPVSARAVAGGGSTAPTCICLMNSTGADLSLSNNAQINAAKCGVVDDSSTSSAVGLTGSAALCSMSLGTISTTWPAPSNGASICSTTKVVKGISNGCSLTLTAPTQPATCNANPNSGWSGANMGSGNYQLPLSTDKVYGTSVCYTSINTSNMASLTFSPGYTYYIQGNLQLGQSGAKVYGTGVSFYVGGNLTTGNGVTINLTAPYQSDGSTPSTLFYVNGSSVDIEGGSSSVFQGLLYAPNANVTIGNGTSTTLTMDVYAQTLTMSGGAVLNSYADKNLGSLSLGGSQLVE